MRFLKKMSVILFIFVLAFVGFKCNAVRKDQIIIGTYDIYSSEIYNYVTEALENGFTNIETAKDYYNQDEAGKAIRDFESKSVNNRAYVIAKFSIPSSYNDNVFMGFRDDLEIYIKNQINIAREKLGHVDEFILYKKLYNGIPFSDVAMAYGEIKKDELYKDIKFGISTLTLGEFEKLRVRNLLRYVEVVQNPYWYGSDFLLNLFDMGDEVYKECKIYGIKYETYRTLGCGRLVRERHFLPSVLVQHSVNKGYVPIVRATGKKHLNELIETVDDQMVLPEMEWSDENSTFNIKILNSGQTNVISSTRYWFRG